MTVPYDPATAKIVFTEPTLYQRGAGVLVGLILIIMTISLLRRFKMQERHGLWWLMGGVGLILLSVFPPLLRLLTHVIGAGNPTTAVFAGCILFLLIQNLVLTLAISRQRRQLQDLAIELALQRAQRQREPELAGAKNEV